MSFFSILGAGAKTGNPYVMVGAAAVGLIGAAVAAFRQPSRRIEDSSSTSSDFRIYRSPSPVSRRISSEDKGRDDQVSESKKSESDEESSEESDEESSQESEEESESDDTVSVSSHVTARLERFVRFGGMLQRISEETSISRLHVARSGTSQYQDRSSSRRGFHAAHVVRVSDIHSRIRNDPRFSRFYSELRNFGGHTQIVSRYANVWYGLGGNIDRLQSRFLSSLAEIDFSSGLTEQARTILKDLRQQFVDILTKFINGAILSQREKEELKRAKREIRNMDIGDLFRKGRDGYSGRHTRNYQ